MYSNHWFCSLHTQICDFLVANTGHLLNPALSTSYNVRNANNERIEIDKGFDLFSLKVSGV